MKENHRVGDIKVVEFIKNQREGRKPVCVIDGMICFISRNYHGKFINERSVWHVEIDEIKDKIMVVNPIQEIKSSFENLREINNRMKLLQTKHVKKHVKPKAKYVYKSKQEQNEEKR